MALNTSRNISGVKRRVFIVARAMIAINNAHPLGNVLRTIIELCKPMRFSLAARRIAPWENCAKGENCCAGFECRPIPQRNCCNCALPRLRLVLRRRHFTIGDACADEFQTIGSRFGHCMRCKAEGMQGFVQQHPAHLVTR